MLKNDEVIKKFFGFCGHVEAHNDNLMISCENRTLISFGCVLAQFIKVKKNDVEKTFLLINPRRYNRVQSKHVAIMYDILQELKLSYHKAYEVTEEDVTLLSKTDLRQKGWRTLYE